MSGRQQIIDRYSSLSALHKLQLIYTKPQQIIHGWVEHLMLERLVCNTYYVELHRPEGDRFSVVCIQIFALPVRSHLAGFFKA